MSYGVLSAFDDVAAASDDAVLVTGVAGSRIDVLGFVLSTTDASSDTLVTFGSDTTALSAGFTVGAGAGSLVVPQTDGGLFTTADGEDLTVTTGAGSTVGILVTYRLLPV